jgi:branched-chain amino acid aminotransferase
MGNINWDNLGFAYRKTATILKCSYSNGAWGEIESLTDDNITISSFAGCLHYSIECFEGLKAFRGKDGKIRIFRPEENARRLQASAASLFIPAPSEELFISMCKRLVKENIDYLPPYGHNASLYIRPTLVGSNPQLGVKSSSEVTLYMLCSPVGAYVGGTLQPCNAVIARNHDRAATYGTGRFKVGGNYAASLYALNIAHQQGYAAVLHLDPAQHKYIDEFNSSNFFGIHGNTYVTPLSDSILPSITNKSLVTVAEHLGMTVERRPVLVEEMEMFEEVGECGTAVVITPVSYIDDKCKLEDEKISKRYTFYSETECGPKSLKLYKMITGIQYGEIEDPFGWCTFVEE